MRNSPNDSREVRAVFMILDSQVVQEQLSNGSDRMKYCVDERAQLLNPLMVVVESFHLCKVLLSMLVVAQS